MTKYLTLDKKEKPEPRKTVFFEMVNEVKSVVKAESGSQPKYYEIVIFLGHDKDYGDTFFVQRSKDRPDDFGIFFGVKGDEFND